MANSKILYLIRKQKAGADWCDWSIRDEKRVYRYYHNKKFRCFDKPLSHFLTNK